MAPVELDPVIAKLYAELDGRSTKSCKGEVTSEPFPCVRSMRLTSRAWSAYVNHGIDGRTDNVPDGEVYEEFKPPKLSKQSKARIRAWCHRIRPPRRNDTSAMSYRTAGTMQSHSTHGRDSNYARNGDHPNVVDDASAMAASVEFETLSSSDDDGDAARPACDDTDRFVASIITRPPLDGDLSTETNASYSNTESAEQVLPHQPPAVSTEQALPQNPPAPS
jgi:hypothetical protein